MREKNFQVQFGHWVKQNLKGRSMVFELKSVKGDSCPFSLVKEHQIAGLYHTQEQGISFKLPDGFGFQWPFDYLTIKAKAFVVIRYGNGEWYAINILDFIEESKNSTRRSIISSRAFSLSTYSSLTNGLQKS